MNLIEGLVRAGTLRWGGQPETPTERRRREWRWKEGAMKVNGSQTLVGRTCVARLTSDARDPDHKTTCEIVGAGVIGGEFKVVVVPLAGFGLYVVKTSQILSVGRGS